MTKEERFVQDIINANEDPSLSVKDVYNIVTAHDDAVRRECAVKSEKWFEAWLLEDHSIGDPEMDCARLCSAILGTEPARDYTEDASHENGNYSCVCVTCGATFTGHKRRMQCKACATEPAREAVGTESTPFKGTYNPIVFQRHDSDLKLGVCERDDGFEFVVHGTNKRTSHYALHPDATMERLDEPAREENK